MRDGGRSRWSAPARRSVHRAEVSSGLPRLRVSGRVYRSVSPHGGSILLDVRAGQWFALNRTADLLWQEWQRRGDVDAALAALARRHPDIPAERLAADSRQLAAALRARGLVVPVSRRACWRRGVPASRLAWVSPDADAVSGAGADTGVGTDPGGGGRAACAPAQAGWSVASGPHRMLPTVALLLTVVLLRMPFRVTVAVLRLVRRLRCRTEATVDQARWALGAVERSATRFPVRVACLETSLATVLTLALAGVRLRWCLGVADDPCRFHAWTEADGQVVGVDGPPGTTSGTGARAGVDGGPGVGDGPGVGGGVATDWRRVVSL